MIDEIPKHTWLGRHRSRVRILWILFWHRSGIWTNPAFTEMDRFHEENRKRRKS